MEFRTRKMVMPQDLNGAGTLFGGRALAWIDEEAAVFVICQLGAHRVVTKLMSEINFLAPAKQGDIVEIGAELVGLGKTSITISCVMRNKTSKQDILRVEKMVFVLIDENGHPTPHGRTMPNTITE